MSDDLRVICPVCNESLAVTAADGEAMSDCPRCGSRFSALGATVVHSKVGPARSGGTSSAPPQSEPIQAEAGAMAGIPGYQILGPIAQGGMGMVLRARQTELDRIVALKIPKITWSTGPLDKVMRERFVREARLAARLRHPNICPIYDVGEHRNRPYIAMGYIEGENLRDWARDNRPNNRQAAQIVARLARGVDYAHQHGVIHRDIKPANVMIDAETRQPILMDFGLAREASQDSIQITQVGHVVGTPAYMAPEQASGERERIGPHTDVYALGAILYDLLCDHPPFTGSVSEVLRRVQTEDPVPPRRSRPHVPRGLETICLKALSKEPSRRYASAAALADDLDHFCNGEAIQARPDSIVYKVVRKVRHNRFASVTMVLVLLALAAVGYFALRASSVGKVSSLVRDFEAAVESDNWAPEPIRQQDAMLQKLQQLSPDQAAASRQHRSRRLTDYLGDWLRRPALQAQDVAEIRRHLATLAAWDAQSAQTLEKSLHQRLRVWQVLFDLSPPFSNLDTVFPPSEVRLDGKTLLPAAPAQSGFEVRTRIPSQSNIQVEAVFDESWQTACRLGVILNAGQDDMYSFLVRAPVPERAAGSAPAAGSPPTFATLRATEQAMVLEILRNNIVIQQQVQSIAPVDKTRLRIVATWEGPKVSLQVDRLPPLVFEDAFPIRTTRRGMVGLCWPVQARLSRLRAFAQALPVVPSPLEQGDDFYARGQYDQALEFYRRQAIESPDPQTVQEALYKQGASLRGLSRHEEACGLLERLAAETASQWTTLAACQLWLVRLEQNRLAEADAIFESLSTRYQFEKLAVLIPANLRNQVMDSYRRRSTTAIDRLFRPAPACIGDLKRLIDVSRACGMSVWSMALNKQQLFYLYVQLNQFADAETVVKELLRDCPEEDNFARDYSALKRLQGRCREALDWLVKRMEIQAGVCDERHLTLLLERSRVHGAMDRWDKAKDDVEEFHRRIVADRFCTYQTFGMGCLMTGLLRERRGDQAGALQAWRRGLPGNYCKEAGHEVPASPFRDVVGGGGTGLLCAGILASLTGELTDADAADIAGAFRGHQGSSSVMQNLERAMEVDPSVLREMWRSPRGRQCAWKWVMEFRPGGGLADAGRVYAVELIRQKAFAGEVSPEQDELVWTFVLDGITAFGSGELSFPQLVQFVLTWKGTTNFLGWQGLAPALKPTFRGRAAYVMAHRYLRLKRPDQSLDFLQTAIKDSAPGSPLRRLAQADLDALKPK